MKHFFSIALKPFSPKQILILNLSLEPMVACVFIPLNCELGDIILDMNVVERWKFGSTQQKRVLHPVTLAEASRVLAVASYAVLLHVFLSVRD
jgi:hypothetical protein